MDLITRDEKVRIEQQLQTLIENRPVISKRIEEARALGDLKENAEYHAAKEDQGLQEAEIRRLEERLATCSVVDGGQGKELGVVFIGATVRLKDETDGEVDTYRLVGEASGEEDDDVFEVTTNSPMGEALMKAEVGETINVRTPRGDRKFTVVEIL